MYKHVSWLKDIHLHILVKNDGVFCTSGDIAVLSIEICMGKQIVAISGLNDLRNSRNNRCIK